MQKNKLTARDYKHFNITSFSFYAGEIEKMKSSVITLKKRGYTKASNSWLMRRAIEQFNSDSICCRKMPKWASNYRKLCGFTLYSGDLVQLNTIVAMLKQQGVKNANKSWVARSAILSLSLDSLHSPAFYKINGWECETRRMKVHP